MLLSPKIFKAYDIRAEIGVELDAEGAARIAQAFTHEFLPKKVALSRDMRISGEELLNAMAQAFVSMGVDVVDLGLLSTDASYYASGVLDVDYVVQITASHNPPRYNGLKISHNGITLEENEILQIRDTAVSDQEFAQADQPGTITQVDDIVEKFVEFSVGLIDVSAMKPLNVLVDAANGMAGKLIPVLEKYLPIKVTPMYFELDGNFPNHLANPLIPEAQEDAKQELQKGNYDIAVLFDGDGDRMFLMDENGEFISGTITTAMVAKEILSMNPGETILYNAICGRIVPETVEALGGKSERVRVGHSIIKAEMAKHDAIFAGEHSGHYFFREFYKADSGLIALLFVLQLLSKQNKKTSEVVSEFDIYPGSGEINFEIEDKDGTMKALEEKYASSADTIDWLDGVTIWFDTWWANVRPSNTQPVLRLNIEADTAEILAEKTAEFVQFMQDHGGVQTHE